MINSFFFVYEYVVLVAFLEFSAFFAFTEPSILSLHLEFRHV